MTNKKTGEAELKQADFIRKDHWEHIYSDKKSTAVSWYQQCPECSIDLIKATGVEKSAFIIDVGGGASTLVDFLLVAGYQNISVLDIAHSAIAQAKARLGSHAEAVEWLEQDVTKFSMKAAFDVWHDRAVFHFLTDEKDRLSYLQVMNDALKGGGHAIMATFNLDGPEKCSGLDIVRYSPETMAATLGEGFQLIETKLEKHETPDGHIQSFVYCRFVKI